MRILHLYAGNLFGGIERMLLALARTRDAGDDAPHHRDDALHHHFGLCFEGQLSEKLRETRAEVSIFGPVRVSRPWTVSGARRRLRELIDRERFDVALTHDLWPHGLFAPAVRRAGLPLVMWMHQIAKGRGWLENWARRVPPDLVLANSAFTASGVARVFPGSRCEVQYPVIEPPPAIDRQRARAHWRAELRTPADARVIVIACRWERLKGHEVLLKALSLLPAQTPWSCWIAGQPRRPAEHAYRARIEQLIEQLKIPLQVRFLGHCDDIADVFAAADLYCQPNTSPEAFGLVFVEALSAGLPVVTTDLGAAREIIDGTCGRLVPAGDVEALSAQLDVLLSDAALRARLCEEASRRVSDKFELAGALGCLQKHLEHAAERSLEPQARVDVTES